MRNLKTKPPKSPPTLVPTPCKIPQKMDYTQLCNCFDTCTYIWDEKGDSYWTWIKSIQNDFISCEKWEKNKWHSIKIPKDNIKNFITVTSKPKTSKRQRKKLAAKLGSINHPSRVFPDINPQWFHTGFPSKIMVGDITGELINYIPINVYAKENGRGIFLILPKYPDRLGYIDIHGKVVEEYNKPVDFVRGQRIFTILIDKNADVAKDSKLVCTSYWSLLSEVTSVDPGSIASKTIHVKHGVTKSQYYDLARSTGIYEPYPPTDPIKENVLTNFYTTSPIYEKTRIASSLYNQSFGTNIDIDSHSEVSVDVEFQSENVAQRIATYQYYEQFKIEPGKELSKYVDRLNNKKYNPYASFGTASFDSKPFDYPTNVYRKTRVLEC